MRVRANNFTLRDLPVIVQRCHEQKIRAYLALNTIIYENELNEIHKLLSAAKKADVDAVICWDFAVIAIARGLDLPIHLSTQSSVANSAALSQYQALGISRFVLARECSLHKIKNECADRSLHSWCNVCQRIRPLFYLPIFVW
jgi:putative protease